MWRKRIGIAAASSSAPGATSSRTRAARTETVCETATASECREPPPYNARTDALTALPAALRRRGRDLLLRNPRLPRHRCRGAPVLDDDVRPLRARDRGDGLLPVAARPDGRGGTRQVRLPLCDAGGVGASARALSRSAAVQADRRRARR